MGKRTAAAAAWMILSVHVLCASPLPGAPHRAYWLNVQNLNYSRLLAASALEGIVNRSGPALMLQTGSLFWSWPQADAHWISYYTAKGFQFHQLPSLQQAVRQFRSDIQGVVLYDPAQDGCRYAACTLAALQNSIPVTSALQKQLPALPVTADLRSKWKSSAEAYRWAVKNLLPRCSKKICYSVGRSHAGTSLGGDGSVAVGLDYAFYRRAFFFNLSPNRTPAYGYPGYPQQAQEFNRILDSLPKPAAVYGWAEPEPEFCRRVSQNGDYIACSAAPNLSFHAAAGKKYPQLAALLPRKHIAAPPLRPLCYIDFETNEGDTPKIAAAWQMGAWFNPQRGKIPVSWGLTALLARDAPALYHAYAASAASNDGFFSGVSGGGYCLLDLLPDLNAYARHTRRMLQLSGERVADVWESQGVFRPKLLQKFIEETGLKGISHFPVPGRAGVYYLPDGAPVILPDTSLFYYQSTDPAAFAQHIRQLAAAMPRPCFIECYGNLGANAPAFYYSTMQNLGTGFCAATLAQMVHLAREAGAVTLQGIPVLCEEGQPVPAVITLRNQGGMPAPVRLALHLPAGWRFEMQGSLPAVLQPHTSIARTLLLFAGPKGGMLTASSGAVQLSEQVQTGVTSWQNPCSSPQQWHAESGVESAQVSLANGHVRFTCPEKTAYAPAELAVPKSFRGRGWLAVHVLHATGQWSLKVRLRKTGQDVALLADNSRTGWFYAPLPDTPAWQDASSFVVRFFVIGAGAHADAAGIRLVQQR